MDYNFLKSGRNHMAEEEGLSEEMAAFIISNVQVYMEEAITCASHYVVHCGRTMVTKSDILKALQYVAPQDKDFWDKMRISIKKLRTI